MVLGIHTIEQYDINFYPKKCNFEQFLIKALHLKNLAFLKCEF